MTDISIQDQKKNRDENVIMVADDDMFTRTVISKSVNQFGKVIEIFDGAVIVDTYKKVLPDIVFLDIHLPQRSGFEVLEDIKAFDENCYIIMISSDTESGNVSKAIQMGATEFVGKPFDRKKLESTCKKCPTLN